MRRILIVGAGQAGQALAGKLRRLASDATITLIGDEPVPPYQRPPLSKKYLLGEMARERLLLRPASWYDEERIGLMLGRAVSGIDREGKTVTLGGEILSYDALALTTGSVPRTIPTPIGGGLDGVYTVRTISDIDAMATEFLPGRSLLVVGGGYIGLEAAAVAARRGLSVVLVEAAARILQRVAAPETASFFRIAHEVEGVDIREGSGLKSFIGSTRVEGAILTDGSRLDCDFAVVGVGVAPNTRIAQAAGLTINNGIAVDEFCRTSDPAVYAAGDCASFPYHGQRLRLESVGNAIDMGEAAAASMVGQGKPYLARPWFWSDQFDIKLQIAGLSEGYDRIVTRSGLGRQSHWYFLEGKLLAVDAMNDSRAYMIGRRLVECGDFVDPGMIADPTTDLMALCKG